MNKSLEEKLVYGKEQLKIGNYGRVATIGKKLIDNRDQSFLKEGLLLLGLAHYYENNLEEAKRNLSSAIEQFPNYEAAYYYRIDVFIELGEFSHAREDALKLIEFDNQNVEYLNKLLGVDQYLGDQKSVIETCNKILVIAPNDPLITYYRGGAKSELENFEAANVDFYKALELEEREKFGLNLAMLYNDLGYSFSRMQNYTAAKIYFTKGLKLDPTEPFLLDNLGFALFNLNEIEKGLELINQSLKIDSSNSYGFKNRAKIYLAQGELEKAKKDLLRAKELDYEVLYGDEVNQLLQSII